MSASNAPSLHLELEPAVDTYFALGAWQIRSTSRSTRVALSVHDERYTSRSPACLSRANGPDHFGHGGLRAELLAAGGERPGARVHGDDDDGGSWTGAVDVLSVQRAPT